MFHRIMNARLNDGDLRRIAWLLLCALTFTLADSSARADKLDQRWLYLQKNLQVPENVPEVEALLKRAVQSGYNGVVLADYKLNILDRVPDHYFKHAGQVKKRCDELKLELIPAVAPFGYSDGLLAHNPNLAEALPVRDAPLTVSNAGRIELAKPASLLPGGGFEDARGDAAGGWDFQDGAGEFSFIDTAAKHGGKQSLRWQRRSGTDYVNARISRLVKCTPYQQLHASIWIKTQDYAAANDIKLFAIGADGRTLSHSNLGVKREQDWTEHHTIINTLGNTEVRFYCGTWGLRSGILWMDDLQLTETAFVNLVRRTGCPLKVVSAADGATFEEGRDFEPLSDLKMGRIPWDGNFDVYHEPPVLKLTKSSRIQPGALLKVSYFHTVTIYDNQVCCCLADPEVFQVLEKQVRRVDTLFSPKTFFLSHDEIRLANWCDACRRDGQTAGQLLAENMRRCVATIRKVSPGAKLCVWSDMFDPHHNAVGGPFYLVNGDLSGSWEGLPKDMLIVNWNSGKPSQSLPFFTGRGHANVLAGFYDHDSGAIKQWQATGRETKSSVTGVMYTTWQNDFSKLEEFARHAWGE
jgi:hypothetical protein